MKSIFSILFVVIITTSHAQNLITNGEFETATVGVPVGNPITAYPTELDGWSAVDTDGEFIFSSTLAHTGTGFMSVLQNANANPLSFWLDAPYVFGSYDRVIDEIPVSPSTTYNLEFWLRAGDGSRYGYTAGTLLIQVEQLNPSHEAIDSLSIYTPADWTLSTFDFTTGPSCTNIALLFSCYGPVNVDAWIDDMCLTAANSDCDGTTDIPLSNDNGTFTIFPNPFTNQLHLISSDNGKTTISLYNCLGEQVLIHPFTGSTTINTEPFPPGMYFYEVHSASGIVEKGKVIRQ